MPSIQLPPMPARSVEMVFSPPAGTSTEALFRSPRPARQSKIRVVTRIRPLLEEELQRGRKAAILPLQPLSQSEDGSPTPIDHGENTSPTNHTTPKMNKSLQSIPLPSSSSRRKTPNNNSSNNNIVDPSSTPSSLLNDNIPQSSFQTSDFQTPVSSSSLPMKASRQNHTPSNSQTPTSLYAKSSPALRKRFDFDAVLGMSSTQQQTYEIVVGDSPLRQIFNGVNFTIMAYGQTSSGKTYTMQGYNDASSPSSPHDNMGMSFQGGEDSENQCPNSPVALGISEHDGIIPRVIHDLFQGKMDYKASGKGDVSMELTYFELYNDEIKDLLTDDDEFRALKMLDQGEGGVIIEGLTSVPIGSAAQVHSLIRYAAKRRATSSTHSNLQSSRSHAICTLTVRTSPSSTKGHNGMKDLSSEVTQAKLTLVDLAGSERLKKSGVMGQQQQESITINKDLFVLGKVVSALADKSRSASKGKQTHIPFRDSKLTRLLRESLGGNCMTILISCISPSDIDLEESINTLRYAERARSISNSVKRNVTPTLLSPSECAALQEENKFLKVEISKLKNRVAAEISRETAGSLLDQDEEHLPEENRAPTEMSNAKEIFRLPTTNKAIVQDIMERPRPTSSKQSIQERFKLIANLAGHVPDIQKVRRSIEPAEEVELQEVLSSDSGSDDQNRGGPRQAVAERCLAYEMSLLSNDTDDLKGDDEEYRVDQQRGDTEQMEKLASLQKEYDELQNTVEKIKAKSQELEGSLNTKRQELVIVAQDVDHKNGELQTVQSDLEKLKLESEQLKSDQKEVELEEGSTHLEKIIEIISKNPNILASASPQKSFSSFEKDALGPRTVDILTEEESMAMTDHHALEQSLETSIGMFQESFEILGSALRKSPEDVGCDISNMIDMAAAVKEQQHRIKDLEISLLNEQRKGRENDRNIAFKDSQVQGLQDQIEELEQGIEARNSERQASEKRTAEKAVCLQDNIRSLETKLQEEKQRSATFEARHNFLIRDYESAAVALNDKITSLRNQAKEEKQQSQVELDSLKRARNDLKTAKEDIEYQVETLKNSVAEIANKLEIERQQKQECEAKVLAMQETVDQLKETLEMTKVENKKVQESMRESHSKELAELSKRLQQASKKKETKTRDASTSTSDDGMRTSVELKKEDVQDALLQIIVSTSGDAGSCENRSPNKAEGKGPSPNSIRTQAEKLLLRAEAHIDSSSIAASSALSSSAGGTFFRPSRVQEYPLCQPVQTSTGEETIPKNSQLSTEEKEVHITNMREVKEQNPCSCSSNVFAANKEYVEFYLPMISVDCTCGRMSPKQEENDEDPCALASILRPWQVEFLADVGIKDAVSFFHENNQRGGLLAKSLRMWRKAKGMPSIKTRSCSVALHIWSRTCKSVVRSVRSQEANGEVPKRPDFLELNISENNTAVSSLGGGPFRLGATPNQ